MRFVVAFTIVVCGVFVMMTTEGHPIVTLVGALSAVVATAYGTLALCDWIDDHPRA